jgi:hypothetical protein
MTLSATLHSARGAHGGGREAKDTRYIRSAKGALETPKTNRSRQSRPRHGGKQPRWHPAAREQVQAKENCVFADALRLVKEEPRRDKRHRREGEGRSRWPLAPINRNKLVELGTGGRIELGTTMQSLGNAVRV